MDGRDIGKGLCRWFKSKKKHAEGSFRLGELSVEGGYEEEEEEEDDVVGRLSASSLRMDPYVSQNELRIFVGTWNVAGRSPAGSSAVEIDKWLNLKDAADMYVLGFQEIVPLKTKNVIGGEDLTEASNWNTLIRKALNERYGCPWATPMVHPILNDIYQYGDDSSDDQYRGGLTEDNSESSIVPDGGCRYELVASKKMVGVFISVWMRRELLIKYHVSKVKACSVPCGIMNFLGNKGSVAVSMAIEGTSFCFVTAHLASGEKKGDEGHRNRQVSEIFKRTTFPRSHRDVDEAQPLTIIGHDLIFWFGDLNYRLYVEKQVARQLIKGEDWRALQEFDQLRREQEDGVFQGWEEGDIQFAPTYKYSSLNSNRYSGGIPRRPGEKARIPAWCDRIMWSGKGVRQLSYFRSEIKLSDHRPVSAMFSTQIEAAKSDSRVTPFPAKTPILRQEHRIHNKENKNTLLSMIVQDIRSSPREERRLDQQVFLEADYLESCINQRQFQGKENINDSFVPFITVSDKFDRTEPE